MKLAVAASLLLLVLPAARAGEPPAPVGSSTWLLSLQGKPVGREEAHLAEEGGGLVLTSKAEVKLTATPFLFTQRLEVGPDGPVAYRLDSLQVQASFQAEGAKVVANIMGTQKDAVLRGDGPRVVLDNLVCSHYDLLGREAVRRSAFAFVAVVPQVVAGLPASIEPKADVHVRGPQGERLARRAAVTIGNLLVELLYDAETGAAYRVTVPSQAFEGRREGWSEVAPAGPDAPKGPLPDGPAPFREVEVRFDAPLGPVPGTLTLPADRPGPWPAAIFLHGSGPNDRDETIGPNKPLRDLARHLAALGVATLRYDKRTWLLVQELRSGDPKRRDPATAALRALTLDGEVTQDALAALAFLRAREDVREDALFVVGHSLGAMVAPEVATKDGTLKGVVGLCGPGRRLDELMVEQMTYQATLAGKSPEEAGAEAKKALAPLADGGAGLGDEQMVLGASGRYWKDVLAREPVKMLAACPAPVLLLHGAEDCQVRPADHERLKAALEGRQGVAFEARLLPGLNHLLMPVTGKSTGAEYFVESHVAPEVGEAIADWIEAQVAGDE